MRHVHPPLHVSTGANGERKTLITMTAPAFTVSALAGILTLAMTIIGILKELVPPIAAKEVEKHNATTHVEMRADMAEQKRDCNAALDKSISNVDKSLAEIKTEIRDLRAELREAERRR